MGRIRTPIRAQDHSLLQLKEGLGEYMGGLKIHYEAIFLVLTLYPILSHFLIQGTSDNFLGQGKTKEKTNYSGSDSWNHSGTIRAPDLPQNQAEVHHQLTL